LTEEWSKPIKEIPEKVQKSLITSTRDRLHRYEFTGKEGNLCNPLLESV
jgi:hypothetical protein